MLAFAARGPCENAWYIKQDGLNVIGISPISQTLVHHAFKVVVLAS